MLNMKPIKTILVFIIFTFLTVNIKAQITVAVAANVQYAMKDLKAEFLKETGIKISVIIGSSGQLTAQINEGAPYDVFISADMKYPNALYKENEAVNSPKVYAKGALVIWTLQKEINFTKELKILLSNKIKKIALANPSIAPYGAASVETLEYFGLYNKVKNKLVYGESIAPTNQFIISGAADVGFTAKSIVMSTQMKGKGTWEEIDKAAYKPIEQGCVILKYGNKNHKIRSKKFYDFLFSAQAKEILKKYGYIVK